MIPARGGSKGVPRKNLRPVGGAPLVVRAILAARAVPAIDRVIVSTDDPAIARIAAAVDAQDIDRPGDLAGDAASSESALLHVLDVLEERGEHADVLVFLQATSPFIDRDALAAAVERVRRGEDDCVFSAVESYVFLWRNTVDGAVGVNHDAASRPRRQDRDACFAETGAFYVLDAAGFRRARHRFFGRVGFAPVDPRTALEIDTPEELEVAAALAELLDGDLRTAETDESAAIRPLLPSSAPAIDVDAVVAAFDGVRTENRLVLTDDGHDYVTDPVDGPAFGSLAEAGVPLLLLSSDVRRVADARARIVPVEVIHGTDDKLAALRYWAGEHRIDLERVAYLGVDADDLGCLAAVGWPVATADAPAELRAAARVLLAASRGRGAVRELTERVLRDRDETLAEPRTAPVAPRRIHELSRRESAVHELPRGAGARISTENLESKEQHERPHRIASRR
ncbi:MAG: acylneuraminate cytidylyltransferase [Micrococcales bacterium]|nr:acylneuraminate cytidylyltransferase [Micrococcales bacterium]